MTHLILEMIRTISMWIQPSICTCEIFTVVPANGKHLGLGQKEIKTPLGISTSDPQVIPFTGAFVFPQLQLEPSSY